MSRRKVPLSIRDQIYAALQAEILANRFAPGEELQIDKLAMEYGVSTTPVREALILLHNAGLATLNPNKGARVAAITEEDIINTFEVRLVLEPYAAGKTALLSLEEPLSDLEAKVRRVMDVSQTPSDFREIDFALHELLYIHLPNNLIKDFMHTIYQLSVRIRYYAQEGAETKPEIARLAAREHLGIVEALKKNNPQKAEAAVKRHLLNSRKRTLQAIQTRARAV
jgi:DNA-binding GntR family transcriptional regulator